MKREEKQRKKVHPTGKGPRKRGQKTDGRLLKERPQKATKKKTKRPKGTTKTNQKK